MLKMPWFQDFFHRVAGNSIKDTIFETGYVFLLR
jgi:hypothetical protein